MKRTLIIILFGIFALNILTLTGYSLEKKAKVNYYNKGRQEQLKLMLNNGNIVLTASLVSGQHFFGNFKLKIGNIEKSFDWKSIGNVHFPPSMRLIDLGNDKNAGVAIFLIEAKGMGIFVQRVHIFKINNFNEIPVENPLMVVENHIKIQGTNDSIIIDIDGNKTVLDKNYLNNQGISNPRGKMYYDKRIVYGFKNNSLSTEVGICNDNFIYIGTIDIDYIFRDEKFIVNKIDFKRI